MNPEKQFASNALARSATEESRFKPRLFPFDFPRKIAGGSKLPIDRFMRIGGFGAQIKLGWAVAGNRLEKSLEIGGWWTAHSFAKHNRLWGTPWGVPLDVLIRLVSLP